MNIVLIRVSRRTIINPSIGQPLGIMYLASYLRKYRQNKDNITLIDMKLNNYSCKFVAQKALNYNPDIIGLSCFSTDSEILHNVSNALRAQGFKGPIVAGGPHPTADPEETLKDKNINIVVLGEGEKTFLNIINRLDEKKEIHGIQGTAFRENGGIKIIENTDFIKDLDSIPFPAWDLIDFERYFKYFSNAPLGKRRYMQIMTSRGCPYRCTYCHNIFGKSFRTRSTANVLEEIRTLYYKYNISEFEIMDDVFNFDIKRAEEILDGIISLGLNLKFSFPNGLRGDRLPPELIRKLKRAGTYYAGIAIETASPRLQIIIKKNLKLDKVKEAIQLLSKEGIYTNGFLMFGFPTESKEEMVETFKFAMESALNIAQTFVLNPFKGSEIYKQINLTTRSSKMAYFDYNVTPINYSLVNSEEFSKLLWKEYIKFYLYRLRFLHSLIRYPRKRYFLHYVNLIIARIFLHFYNRFKLKWKSTFHTTQKLTSYEV